MKLKLALALILLCACSTTKHISREPHVHGGVPAAIETIMRVYCFDTCTIVDTVGNMIKLKCR